MSRALAMREIGQLPISIASSLALEGLLGIHPDNPDQKDRTGDYKELWINVRTLIRNIDGAIQKDNAIFPKEADYYHCLMSEIQVISNHLKTKVGDNMHLVFYTMSYQRFTSFWPHAIFKDKNTDIQLRYVKMENRVLELLFHDVKQGSHGGLVLSFFDTHINGVGADALVMTHFPVDMLLTVACKFKGLLESHTGKIKSALEWNTKLKDGRNLPRIPFDKCMIQIFGDASGMIKSQDKKVRAKILEIADKHQWNASTTKERVKLTVELAKEPVLKALVDRLY